MVQQRELFQLSESAQPQFAFIKFLMGVDAVSHFGWKHSVYFPFKLFLFLCLLFLFTVHYHLQLVKLVGSTTPPPYFILFQSIMSTSRKVDVDASYWGAHIALLAVSQLHVNGCQRIVLMHLHAIKGLKNT